MMLQWNSPEASKYRHSILKAHLQTVSLSGLTVPGQVCALFLAIPWVQIKSTSTVQPLPFEPFVVEALCALCVLLRLN